MVGIRGYSLCETTDVNISGSIDDNVVALIVTGTSQERRPLQFGIDCERNTAIVTADLKSNAILANDKPCINRHVACAATLKCDGAMVADFTLWRVQDQVTFRSQGDSTDALEFNLDA